LKLGGPIVGLLLQLLFDLHSTNDLGGLCIGVLDNIDVVVSGSEWTKTYAEQHQSFADLNSIAYLKRMFCNSVAVYEGTIAAAKISQKILAVHELDFGMRARSLGVLKVDFAKAIPTQTLFGFANQVMGAYVCTAYNQKGSQLLSTSFFKRFIVRLFANQGTPPCRHHLLRRASDAIIHSILVSLGSFDK